MTMPNNLPLGAFTPRPLTFRKLPFAPRESAFPIPPSTITPPICWTRPHAGARASILSSRPTPSGYCSARTSAIKNIASFLGPGGHLLVVARGRDGGEPEGQMPWPLTRAELSAFNGLGLEEFQFEILSDVEEPDTRRFRALYRSLWRPSGLPDSG